MAKEYLWKVINYSTISLVLAFLAFDALGTFFYYLHSNGVLESRFFRLGRDRSFFEVMEYFKTGLVIYVFHLIWSRTQEPLFKAWWLLFLVMLIDNAVGVHEEIGEGITIFAAKMGYEWEHLRSIAELAVMAMLEGSALLYVIYCFFKSDKRYQLFSGLLIATIIALAAVSILSEAIGFSRLEEAVEILGLTLLFALVHQYFRREQLRAAAIEKNAAG